MQSLNLAHVYLS